MDLIRNISKGYKHTYKCANNNYIKNRYTDILACDHTLVSSEPYVNANWITSSMIAAQAPYKGYEQDFWDMIITNKINKIVMLTDIDENKCHKYWSEVHISKIKNKDFYIVRYIQIGTYKLKHYQYLGWQDMQIPDISNFNLFLELFSPKDKLLVHCSAGVGRTGVFCVLFLLMHNNKRPITEEDLRDCILYCRKQREGMVYNSVQYQFCLDFVNKYFQK